METIESESPLQPDGLVMRNGRWYLPEDGDDDGDDLQDDPRSDIVTSSSSDESKHDAHIDFAVRPCVVFVYGFGCSMIDNAELRERTTFLNEIQSKLDLDDDEIHTFCDPSTALTIARIAGQCASRQSKADYTFVRQCLDFVRNKMDTHHVILTGVSYGGRIVSQIVQALVAAGVDTTSRLSAQTYGSIYIPPEPSVAGSNLTHVMIVGDIATKCNKLHSGDGFELTRGKQFYDFHGEYVQWLRVPESEAAVKHPMGLQRRWKIHRNAEYAYKHRDFIMDVAETLGTSSGGGLSNTYRTIACVAMTAIIALAAVASR